MKSWENESVFAVTLTFIFVIMLGMWVTYGVKKPLIFTMYVCMYILKQDDEGAQVSSAPS